MSIVGSILFGAVIGWMAARLVGERSPHSNAPIRNWLLAALYLVAAGVFVGVAFPGWLNLIGLPLGCLGFMLFRAALGRRPVTRIDGGSAT